MYMHPDTNLWYNLGWTGDDEGSISWPMLGGSGHPIDPTNPDSYEISPITGDTTGAGQVAANWGYIFDPMGGDGALFSGDEPLAPTGYFFTYNFLEAASIFPEVMNAHLAAGADLESALAAAADSIALFTLMQLHQLILVHPLLVPCMQITLPAQVLVVVMGTNNKYDCRVLHRVIQVEGNSSELLHEWQKQYM